MHWRDTLRDTRKIKGNDGPLEDDESKEKTQPIQNLGQRREGMSPVRGLNMRIKDQLMQNQTKPNQKQIRKKNSVNVEKEAAIWWQMFNEQEF